MSITKKVYHYFQENDYSEIEELKHQSKTKMESITYELNGIKYLLVEILVTPKCGKRVFSKCKKYEVIHQGFKDIKPATLFSSGHAILKVLVPEKNIVSFNND